MALIHLDYLSGALRRTVPVDVILPADKYLIDEGAYQAVPGHGYKTLYLLHGYFGSEHDWLCGTRIRRWAEDKNLAVVMPAGENAFYLDGAGPARAYGQFIGQELPDRMRRMFPLSARREDTFIAGLSMGGYGAMHAALNYPETFSRVAAFSAAFHYFEGASDASMMRALSGFEAPEKTALNPRVALTRLKARIAAGEPGVGLPEMYLSCGLDDGLLSANRSLRDFFVQEGAHVTWYEGPGAHEWDFWDREIKKTLEWLPLNGDVQGLSSGHIGRVG